MIVNEVIRGQIEAQMLLRQVRAVCLGGDELFSYILSSTGELGLDDASRLRGFRRCIQKELEKCSQNETDGRGQPWLE